ncbi:hypothetical protein EB001_11395 [bacterium]|nr:hypothetical protein [bacterium]
MKVILQYIIDFIFPPRDEEVVLRSYSPEKLFEISPKPNNPEFPFIKAIYSYRDPIVREMIWQIKYKKNKHAIECASYALNTELSKIKERVILVPIPISKERRKERGYNQCELIIDELLRLNENNLISKDFDILIRNKNIEKQTFKNKKDRITNTRDIFQVIKRPIDGSKIIIIDDVSTTGSTLNEARDILLKSGFMTVEALTVAH